MAIDIYQRYTNPISGESFKCIALTKDAYTMEWTLRPRGYVPFEHIHYHQDEIFYVQKGELKVTIDGIENIAGAGDAILVPKGVRHMAANNKQELLDVIVTYTPALDYDKFIQCFCGLTIDGYINSKGVVSIPMMGYCLRKMECKAMARPSNIPERAFRLALSFFYFIGTLRGWDKLYKKYTT